MWSVQVKGVHTEAVFHVNVLPCKQMVETIWPSKAQ